MIEWETATLYNLFVFSFFLSLYLILLIFLNMFMQLNVKLCHLECMCMDAVDCVFYALCTEDLILIEIMGERVYSCIREDGIVFLTVFFRLSYVNMVSDELRW